MSDYFDYDDESYYDDSFDEDNYAGALGGYDDMYDNVEYDAWDIVYPEFNFDDERPMFDFDPFSEYFDLKDESEKVMMTYQALGELAGMTVKLLVAWDKRAAADHLVRQEPTLLGVEGNEESLLLRGLNHYQFQPRGLNLYQLEMEERKYLRSNSVWKLEMLLGGSKEVKKLKQVIDNICHFLKRIVLAILGNCLPCPMPYPVLKTILSYLHPVKGAVNIGLVSIDDSREGERKDMERLYLSMAEVFDHVKVIMFNIEPNTLVTEPSIIEKKNMLVKKFEVLVATVTSTELQISFDGLDIKVIEGEEENVAK